MTVELTWDGKYDADGKKRSPLRISLPFQTVETINESVQERQRSLEQMFSREEGKSEWRNRLIWGDKKYVLPSLLGEFAGKVNLIYIDPPFFTGDNFSFQVEIEGEEFTKEPSLIEQMAYHDTWGHGIDSYLKWFYETVVMLNEMLSEDGNIYVHLDWHVGHYAKLILDDVFGRDNFVNEITWYYYNKFAPVSNCFPRASDRIMVYAKSFGNHKFYKQEEKRDEPVKQLKRKFIGGKAINVRDEEGNVQYQEKDTRRVDDVWRIPMLQPADKTEYVAYRTQKPEALLERIVKASSDEGDLVLDCFCGSGTTAAVAEKLGRRWITCDLGRFAIHTARKRLLAIPNVKPFVVQNLGKYERQAWQAHQFGEDARARLDAYTDFILKLYRAQPLSGFMWLHGVKAGRAVHVGAVDSPVTLADVKQIVIEWRKNLVRTSEVTKTGIDVLGWEFALELHETAKQQAAESGVDLRFLIIPREVLEQKAVDQGDIHFYELAALAVTHKTARRKLTLELINFIAPLEYVPQEVRQKITKWQSWVDYWAVDWDFKGDTFHNQWQSYRTRKDKNINTTAEHTYEAAGDYLIQVKAIDILGNDTTRTIKVQIT